VVAVARSLTALRILGVLIVVLALAAPWTESRGLTTTSSWVATEPPVTYGSTSGFEELQQGLRALRAQVDWEIDELQGTPHSISSEWGNSARLRFELLALALPGIAGIALVAVPAWRGGRPARVVTVLALGTVASYLVHDGLVVEDRRFPGFSSITFMDPVPEFWLPAAPIAFAVLLAIADFARPAVFRKSSLAAAVLALPLVFLHPTLGWRETNDPPWGPRATLVLLACAVVLATFRPDPAPTERDA
jgi:hypothetical protein